MSVRRCPECGNRLTSNYCDICMRRVPFAGLRSGRDLDPWDYSSAHREEEDHECVSFDTPKPASHKKPVLKPVFPKSKSAKKTGKKKLGGVVLDENRLRKFCGQNMTEKEVAELIYDLVDLFWSFYHFYYAFLYIVLLSRVHTLSLNCPGSVFSTASCISNIFASIISR